MMSFRYHMVAVTAVLVALAVGLVLGTAALHSTRSDRRQDRTGAAGTSAEHYRGRIDRLSGQADRHEDFDRAMAPRLLAGALAKRTVVVVSLPTADPDQVAGTEKMLDQAGATLTGEVHLTARFTDPSHRDALGDLASTKLPVDIHATVPDDADGVTASTAVLAAVLMTGRHRVSKDSQTTVLTAYSTGGSLSVDKPVHGRAESMIVVAGTPATGRTATQRNSSQLAAVRQFGKSGTTLLAGPGASGRGNVIAATRHDESTAAAVSTVDTLGLVQGRITAVLALARQLHGGVGHYGHGAGATDRLPAAR